MYFAIGSMIGGKALLESGTKVFIPRLNLCLLRPLRTARRIQPHGAYALYYDGMVWYAYSRTLWRVPVAGGDRRVKGAAMGGLFVGTIDVR